MTCSWIFAAAWPAAPSCLRRRVSALRHARVAQQANELFERVKTLGSGLEFCTVVKSSGAKAE